MYISLLLLTLLQYDYLCLPITFSYIFFIILLILSLSLHSICFSEFSECTIFHTHHHIISQWRKKSCQGTRTSTSTPFSINTSTSDQLGGLADKKLGLGRRTSTRWRGALITTTFEEQHWTLLSFINAISFISRNSSSSSLPELQFTSALVYCFN